MGSWISRGWIDANAPGQTTRPGRPLCTGPNQTKLFSRCGMGPCQGRMCGLSVTGILARELSSTPASVGAYRVRSPIKPVPLGAIAVDDAGLAGLSRSGVQPPKSSAPASQSPS